VELTQKAYELCHRSRTVILARSPYLARLLANSMPGGSVQLLFTDENISEEVS
jgi:hypothetical protein